MDLISNSARIMPTSLITPPTANSASQCISPTIPPVKHAKATVQYDSVPVTGKRKRRERIAEFRNRPTYNIKIDPDNFDPPLTIHLNKAFHTDILKKGAYKVSNGSYEFSYSGKSIPLTIARVCMHTLHPSTPAPLPIVLVNCTECVMNMKIKEMMNVIRNKPLYNTRKQWSLEWYRARVQTLEVVETIKILAEVEKKWAISNPEVDEDNAPWKSAVTALEKFKSVEKEVVMRLPGMKMTAEKALPASNKGEERQQAGEELDERPKKKTKKTFAFAEFAEVSPDYLSRAPYTNTLWHIKLSRATTEFTTNIRELGYSLTHPTGYDLPLKPNPPTYSPYKSTYIQHRPEVEYIRECNKRIARRSHYYRGPRKWVSKKGEEKLNTSWYRLEEDIEEWYLREWEAHSFKYKPVPAMGTAIGCVGAAIGFAIGLKYFFQ